jgi:predicted small secreted protein
MHARLARFDARAFSRGSRSGPRMHARFTPGRVPWARGIDVYRPRFPHANEVRMKRLIAMLVLACFTMGPLTACNTMAGAGKDVQKVGEKVEQKAEDCKDAHC